MIVHIAALLLLAFVSTNAQQPEVVGSWTLATFAPPPGFPGASPSGGLVQTRDALFIGLQATKDRFFLGIPRFQPGQPISFGWVPRPPPGQNLPLDTPINPFPDWESHRAAAGGAQSASTNCSGLVSVFHSKLDSCGRLWVLDSGISDALTNFTVSCPPKILAYNPSTGQVLHRYEFGPEVILPFSLFANFALEERAVVDTCSLHTDVRYVYIADTRSPGIVVYDVRNGSAWRHNPPQAYQDPDWGVYTIAGDTFILMDAVIGLTVSKPDPRDKQPGSKSFDEDRTLYFQAFASNRIYAVPTKALQARVGPNDLLPIRVAAIKSSQSNPVVTDPKDGSIVFSPVSQTTIESLQPADNTVRVRAYSPQLLQGVTDIHVTPQEIWALSSRIQKFFTFTVSPEEVNLRIVRIPNTP